MGWIARLALRGKSVSARHVDLAAVLPADLELEPAGVAEAGGSR